MPWSVTRGRTWPVGRGMGWERRSRGNLEQVSVADAPVIAVGRVAGVVEAQVVRAPLAHVPVRNRDLVIFPASICCGLQARYEDIIDIKTDFIAVVHIECVKDENNISANRFETIEYLVRME